MTPDVLLQQLYVLREQVDILIRLVGGIIQQEQVQEGCPHPEQHRRDMTTFGTERRFKCIACGEVVKGIA